MKLFQKSNMQLSKILGATVAVIALTTCFTAPVLAGRYEGGQDRQPERLGVEKPGDGRSQDRQVKPRQERRVERHVDRHRDHRMERIEQQDRHYDRRVDRMERHQERHGHRPPVWRGDMQYYDRHELPRWRGGAWRHARHEGKLGWWWIVGGDSWYFYSQPVYPYPDPYVPPEYFYLQPEYSDPDPYIPPVVIMQSEPIESTPDVVLAPSIASQYWYYCESINGYYPYTTSCPEGWKTVPATPPPAQ